MRFKTASSVADAVDLADLLGRLRLAMAEIPLLGRSLSEPFGVAQGRTGTPRQKRS
jgi:hypothetical protein